jgi:hypothetical protein
MGAPVRVDGAESVRAAHIYEEDPVNFGKFHNIHAIRRLELPE